MTKDELDELTIAELAARGRLLRTLLHLHVRRPRHGHVKVQRGEAVAGTGGQSLATNPEVRALIADCIEAGASVEKSPSGHWRVEYQGHTANISSTPRGSRSVLNDRSRLRRKLGLNV